MQSKVALVSLGAAAECNARVLPTLCVVHGCVKLKATVRLASQAEFVLRPVLLLLSASFRTVQCATCATKGFHGVLRLSRSICICGHADLQPAVNIGMSAQSMLWLAFQDVCPESV